MSIKKAIHLATLEVGDFLPDDVKMLSAEGLSVRKIAAKMDCSAALICKLLKEDHK